MTQLAKTLTYFHRPMPDDMRRGLVRRTADGMARVVLDVSDAAQPMPHKGIVLKGRDIIGWIMVALAVEDPGAEHPGDMITNHLAFFAPDPKGPAAEVLTARESHPTCYPVLYQVQQLLTPHVSTREVYEFDSETAHALVRTLGLIEVIGQSLLTSSRLAKFEVDRAQVLVPDNDESYWRMETLSMARLRACQETRTPAFWNMPTRRTPVIVDDRHIGMTTISPYLLPNDKQREQMGTALAGATMFEHEWFDNTRSKAYALQARRVNSGEGWRFEFSEKGPNRTVPKTVLYPIQAGDTALEVCLKIIGDSALPSPSQITEQVPDARSAFDALAYDAHDRRRRLQFVLDALDINAREIAPRPGPVAPAVALHS